MDLWVVRKIHNALICATTLDMCCSACRLCPQRPVKPFMTTYTLGLYIGSREQAAATT